MEMNKNLKEMNTKTNHLQSDVISEILPPTKWQWLILWVGPEKGEILQDNSFAQRTDIHLGGAGEILGARYYLGGAGEILGARYYGRTHITTMPAREILGASARYYGRTHITTMLTMCRTHITTMPSDKWNITTMPHNNAYKVNA